MRRSHPYPVNPHQDGMTVAAFYAGMAGCSLLIIAVFVALLWVLWPGAARAQDDRTPAQQLMGEPIRERSALWAKKREEA